MQRLPLGRPPSCEANAIDARPTLSCCRPEWGFESRWVVLPRWLSNPSPALNRALRAYRKLDLSQVKAPVRRPVVKRAKTLNEAQVAQLVARYRVGQTTYELADQFGVWRGTVARHLKAAGVTLNAPAMTEREIARAVELYATGMSTAKIGEQLGRKPATVWSALKRVGVQMRDAHGRHHRS